MKLHQLSGYIQNIYLAEYPHGLFLLDGCCRADIKKIESFIVDELKRPFSDLKMVVVTHMHPDHAGAAHQLRKLIDCKIAASSVAGQWYQGIDGYLMHLTDIALTRWVAGRKGKKTKNIWYPRFLKQDVFLSDGQPLPMFDDWQVIWTQGHTDRDISLYHKETGQIYVADLMVQVRNQLIPPYPVFYPRRYRESIDKVANIAPEKILLAHGTTSEINPAVFEHLKEKAPTVPVTHWRSVKSKLRTVFSRS